MSRTTEQDRADMYHMIDLCIEKMNNLKNKNKPHWGTLSLDSIQKMITIENAELDLALSSKDYLEINTEFKDVVILGIFGMLNLHKRFNN